MYAYWHDVVADVDAAGENVGANTFVDDETKKQWARVLVQEGSDFGVAAVGQHVEHQTGVRGSNKTYYLYLNKADADGY